MGGLSLLSDSAPLLCTLGLLCQHCRARFHVPLLGTWDFRYLEISACWCTLARVCPPGGPGRSELGRLGDQEEQT